MDELDQLYTKLELNKSPKKEPTKAPIRLNPSSREQDEYYNLTQTVLQETGDNREELRELRQIVKNLNEKIVYLDERLDWSSQRIHALEEHNKKLEERTAAHTTYLETFKEVLESLSQKVSQYMV